MKKEDFSPCHQQAGFVSPPHEQSPQPEPHPMMSNKDEDEDDTITKPTPSTNATMLLSSSICGAKTTTLTTSTSTPKRERNRHGIFSRSSNNRNLMTPLRVSLINTKQVGVGYGSKKTPGKRKKFGFSLKNKNPKSKTRPHSNEAAEKNTDFHPPSTCQNLTSSTPSVSRSNQSTGDDVSMDFLHAFGSLEVKDHYYRFQKYKRCFLGRDAVDLLISSGYAKTRAEAVELGRKASEQYGLLRHVEEQIPFEDGAHFYTFEKVYTSNIYCDQEGISERSKSTNKYLTKKLRKKNTQIIGRRSVMTKTKSANDSLSYFTDHLPRSLSHIQGQNALHMACLSHPKFASIVSMVEKCPKYVTELNSSAQLPLHVAAGRGASPQVIKYLLENYAEGASIQDIDGKTPLILACEYGCRERACDTGNAYGDIVKGPLLAVIKDLCRAAPLSVNAVDKHGNNALTYALMMETSFKIINFLHKASKEGWRHDLKDIEQLPDEVR